MISNQVIKFEMYNLQNQMARFVNVLEIKKVLLTYLFIYILIYYSIALPLASTSLFSLGLENAGLESILPNTIIAVVITGLLSVEAVPMATLSCAQ